MIDSLFTLTFVFREGSVEWENGNNRKLSLSYNVPTSSSQHSTVTVLTTRIIQVRDYWQNGDAISEPAQLSKDQTETGSSSACLSQFAELQYRKKEIDKLITTLQAVELENLHLQGECLDGLKLRQLQKLQQRLAESFFKVNRAIVDIVEKEQCTICFENERNVVLVPCGICESIGNNILGHLIICNTCAERDLKSCPYCRVRVQSKQRVFF